MTSSIRRISSVIVIAAFFSSCSAFRSATVPFTVVAEPKDAEIYINGSASGKGSASASVKRDANVMVMVRRDGCEPTSRTIGKHLAGIGVLDIIGGVLIIVPFIGLATPGAYDLDETNIAVTLMGCKNTQVFEQKTPEQIIPGQKESKL